jgi:hypothetical protein
MVFIIHTTEKDDDFFGIFVFAVVRQFFFALGHKHGKQHVSVAKLLHNSSHCTQFLNFAHMIHTTRYILITYLLHDTQYHMFSSSCLLAFVYIFN